MSRFPFPLPYGWFHVGYSDKLEPGQIDTVHYFDKDLILWRDEEGG